MSFNPFSKNIGGKWLVSFFLAAVLTQGVCQGAWWGSSIALGPDGELVQVNLHKQRKFTLYLRCFPFRISFYGVSTSPIGKKKALSKLNHFPGEWEAILSPKGIRQISPTKISLAIWYEENYRRKCGVGVWDFRAESFNIYRDLACPAEVSSSVNIISSDETKALSVVMRDEWIQTDMGPNIKSKPLIIIYDLEHSTTEELRTDTLARAPVFSPDSQKIAFFSGGQAVIYTLKSKKKSYGMPVSSDLGELAWSPSGKYIAGHHIFEPRITIMHSDGRVIGTKECPPAQPGWPLVWSRDEQSLTLVRENDINAINTLHEPKIEVEKIDLRDVFAKIRR